MQEYNVRQGKEWVGVVRASSWEAALQIATAIYGKCMVHLARYWVYKG